MNVTLTRILAAALALLTFALPARATNQGTLPEGAIPLTPVETQALYVGHTAKYDIPDGVARYTWKADGKALATWEGRMVTSLPQRGPGRFLTTSFAMLWTSTARRLVSRSTTSLFVGNGGRLERRGG
jgi:hypothetical protein